MIEFQKVLNVNPILKFVNTLTSPSTWSKVELVIKNYDFNGNDLMKGYDTGKKNQGVIYLGKYNDGKK